MWKNVIGGYKRVAGQSNWSARNPLWFQSTRSRLYVDKTPLITWQGRYWSRDMFIENTNSPLAEYNTCRACHCHSLGLSKAPLLSWENPFNIINMFSLQLVTNILLKDGRKKVCPPIHPGECHNIIYCLQSSTLRFSNPVRDVAGMKAPLPDKTEMMLVPLAFESLISLIGSFHHGVCCSGTI